MSTIDWNGPVDEIIRTITPKRVTEWLSRQDVLTRSVRVKLGQYLHSFTFMAISGDSPTLADDVHEVLIAAVRAACRSGKPGSGAHLVWQAMVDLVKTKRQFFAIARNNAA